MGRMITKLFGMRETVSTQLHTNNGDDTMNTGDSEMQEQDFDLDNGQVNDMPEPEEAGCVQEMSISGLQAAADEFNAAFSTALYELESSRRQAREYSARIDDLNESIRIFSGKLHDAQEKSRARDEEYSRRSEHLNQIIKEVEAERDNLQHQASEQVHALNERAGEIDRLSGHVNELNSRLDQQASEAQQALEAHSRETEQLNQRIHEVESEREHLRQQSAEQKDSLNARAEEIGRLTGRIEDLTSELDQLRTQAAENEREFSREREALTGRINEIQHEHDGTRNQLQALHGELEARSNEVAGLKDQVDALSTEITQLTETGRQREQAHQEEAERFNTEIGNLNESLQAAEQQHQQQANELGTKNSEIAWLNDHVSELEDKISEHSESLRREAEAHAGEREALNAEITRIAAELEMAQSNVTDITAHADKLETLNRALHESSISENELHRKLLEEKNAAIETLRQQLDPANDAAADIQMRQASEIQDLQTALHELESRLKQSESQGQSLAERAALADELEGRVAELNTTLQDTRESAARDAIDPQALQSMQDRITELESSLASARTDNESLISKLEDHESLTQEVQSLRESAQQAGNGPVDQDKMYALTEELEKLRSELTASEARREELAVELSNIRETGASGIVNAPVATQDPASPGITIDRDRLMSHLDHLLTEHDDTSMHHTVMYILLDNFIRIREDVGVMNSEQILTQAMQIVASSCDEDDMLARIGDCTFAILCKDAGTDETQEKAGNICSAIARHIFEVDEHSVVVTASIGIDSIRSNDTSAKEVVSRADKACEAARSSGGNQVLVNSNVAEGVLLQGSSDDHAEMVSNILSENRIKIHYQPISSLTETSCNYYEVLTRIVDENGDIILPGEFFSMAVNSGKAMEVDRYVIESIIRMLADNPDPNMKLFIKLNRQSVTNPDFPIWMLNRIKEYQIRAQQLVFEVSEIVLDNELKNMSMLSKALEGVGCGLAIEHYRLDAGPQHLQHIKADYIKIDSGLIQNISNKSECLSKVREIVKFTRQHNFMTVAEGVESPASLSILYELGVDYAQGYFIQAPSGDIEYEVEEIVSEDESLEHQKATFTIG